MKKLTLILFVAILSFLGSFVKQATAEGNPEKIIYVNVATEATAEIQDGLSWATAFSDLNDALDACRNLDSAEIAEIRIAEGTYYPTEQQTYDSSNPAREKTFRIPRNVTLIGGFTGQEVDHSTSGLTILSGDISNGNDNDSYTIVTIEEAHNIKLENVTITGSNGNSNAGGAIKIRKASSIELNNLIITDNKSRDGGGVEIFDSFQVAINDSAFQNNQAQYGGAISHWGNVIASGNTITNTVFQNNQSDYGSVIYHYAHVPLYLTNVLMTENKAIQDGVSASLLYSPEPSSGLCIFNSTIAQNDSYFSPSTINLKVYNNIIVDNTFPESFEVTADYKNNLIEILEEDEERIYFYDNKGQKSESPITTDIFDHSTQNQFELDKHSFAINKGDIQFYDFYPLPEYDLLNNRRIIETIDLGAYEYYKTYTIKYFLENQYLEGKDAISLLGNDPPSTGPDGNSIIGVYVDEELTSEWDNSEAIAPSTVLYVNLARKEFTVSFNSDGGDEVSNQTVLQNGKATDPGTPFKLGYRFGGWYLGNDKWNFDQPITNSITLVAKWSAINYDPIGLPIIIVPAPPPIFIGTFGGKQSPLIPVVQTETNGQWTNQLTITGSIINTWQAGIDSSVPVPPFHLQIGSSSSDIATNILFNRDAIQALPPSLSGITVEQQQFGSVTLPSEGLRSLNNDISIYFRPLSGQQENSQLLERAQQHPSLQNETGNLQLAGTPAIIQTNFQNVPTIVQLPFPSTLSAAQQQSMFAYIEHSDGSNEVTQGSITTLSNGQPAFQFMTNHFSTFALVYDENATEEEPVEDPSIPYIQGYPDGTFKPNAPTTRAQMATMLARFITTNDIPEATASFTDTNNNSSKDAIALVKKVGLFKGKTATIFAPNAYMTRAQMAIVATRWIETNCAENPTKLFCTESHEAKTFTDVSANHSAAKAIAIVNAHGIMTGNSATTFNPSGTLTRAQAVKVLNRLFERSALDVTTSSFTDVPASHWAIGEIEAAIR